MQFVLFVLIFVVIFMAGCGTVSEDSPHFQKNLSQSALSYVDSSEDSRESPKKDALKKAYLERFFSVWREDFYIPKSEDIFWGLEVKGGFDEGKRAIPARFFSDIKREMQVEKYPLFKRKAIMVKNASVRVLPTDKPRFSKIDGYPFDRWQNSYIFAQTPILALHSTKNGEWILIQSSFVSGWVKADSVAFINNKDAKSVQSADFILPLNDKVALKNGENFLENARIGMILPRVKNKILTFGRDLNGNAVRILADFDKESFAPFPLVLSDNNIAQIIERIGIQNYGWGGMYGNRDCSSFVRDIFANFGVWLPRNSLAQAEFGKVAQGSKYMALPKENSAKLAFLREFAMPFRTLIWMKGHIMLYLGEVVSENGSEPIVAHQVWGISDKVGSEILSRASITTLTPLIDEANRINSNNPNARSLLERIEAINILF